MSTHDKHDRSRFETWIRSFDVIESWEPNPFAVHASGDYLDPHTQRAWAAWQAALDKTTVASAERDIGPVEMCAVTVERIGQEFDMKREAAIFAKYVRKLTESSGRVVYQCPRCATGMEVDWSAKPSDVSAIDAQIKAVPLANGDAAKCGWTIDGAVLEMVAEKAGEKYHKPSDETTEAVICALLDLGYARTDSGTV